MNKVSSDFMNDTVDYRNNILTIRDLDLGGRSVTNDAEAVVEYLALPIGWRLFYYDSMNDLSEIMIKDGKFAGFGAVGA